MTRLNPRVNKPGAFALLLITLIVTNLGFSEKATAVSYSENFGVSCYSLSSGLSVLYGGAEVPNGVTSTSAHWQAYTNALMSGCALRLNAIAANLVITFPSGSQPTSFSFATYAVNGNQTGIVTYTDGTTTTFVIPDTTPTTNYLNTVNFTGSGKRISAITFTPVNNPDIYIIDNLIWSAPGNLNLGIPTLSGTAIKGQSLNASVSSDTPGKATFFFDSKRIPSCISILSSGSSPSYSASCTFKPAVSGSHRLQVVFTPTDIGISPGRSEIQFTVGRRSNTR